MSEGLKLKLGIKEMVARANAEIETISVEAAKSMLAATDLVFVDLRDPRELEREGRIPGAFHCPRGMLEFWVDPESPYHKPVFASGKKFIFFCASAWRSALSTKTVQDMGLASVAHLEGGFNAWRKAGGRVETALEG